MQANHVPQNRGIVGSGQQWKGMLKDLPRRLRCSGASGCGQGCSRLNGTLQGGEGCKGTKLPRASSCTGKARSGFCCLAQASTRAQYLDTNFPKDEDGRTYHVGTKNGEVARRILMVGCHSRAASIACLLEPLNGSPNVFHYQSKRNFTTFTGLFDGKPVSIVTSMMGVANMDFAVRESIAVAQCPVAIIRLGTCGILQAPGEVGDLLVASKGSIAIRRNPDAFSCSHLPPYHIHDRILPNHELSQLLIKNAEMEFGEACVKGVLNASADSFYSSQGRTSTVFDDRNNEVIDNMVTSTPEVISLEMETYHLYDLARVSKGAIAASGACIGLMERHTDRVIDMSLVDEKETRAGISCLRALTQFNISEFA